MRVTVNGVESFNATENSIMLFIETMKELNLIESVHAENNIVVRVNMLGGVEYEFKPDNSGDDLNLFVKILKKINEQ